MKIVVFLSDGMADHPLPELHGKTPMMQAHKPHMDRIAREGAAGMIQTIPDGIPPGSDTANMAVMGYDPVRYYTGRSPIEAVSMGIALEADDVAFRTNLVTLGTADSYEQRVMEDYSADEIGSDEAAALIEALNEELSDSQIRFHPGKSYRHCMVWKGGPLAADTTPPHDILTQRIGGHLPKGDGAERIRSLMRDSVGLFARHPVNLARAARGLHTADAVWVWGQGTRPSLPRVSDLYGLRGSVISAVDLIQGLGICAGLDVVEVPGATGNIHTDFAAKGRAAIAELDRGQDYVYLHVEAPDECGHRAERDNKILAIERIDREIIGPVWVWLEQHRQETGEPYRLLSLPDHATPLALRTHTREPVPFALYDSERQQSPYHAESYDESACAKTGLSILEGHTLFGRFVSDEGV